MAPRVTVCIPTYDRTRWLAQAIESAIGQTYADIAIEIHDDATPGDAVRDLVARYDDPRITLVEHDTNAGIVGNFTRSLLQARTEYVLQLGDDDEMHPELIATTVELLDRHPSAGLAHTRFDLIDADGAIIAADTDWTMDGGRPPLERARRFLEASMRYGCRVCSSTALLRRSAVPRDGFRERDFPPFDFACWLRMAAAGHDFAFTPRALCRYRLHTESHSSGVSDLEDDAYVQHLRTLQRVHEVKLEQAGGDRRLILQARRGRAHDLLARVRQSTLPERDRVATAKQLAQAARIEPALLASGEAWLLLAGSLVGPVTVDRLKGR
jgi:glycosyltransferase involved in cell wall biosynthesis